MRVMLRSPQFAIARLWVEPSTGTDKWRQTPLIYFVARYSELIRPEWFWLHTLRSKPMNSSANTRCPSALDYPTFLAAIKIGNEKSACRQEIKR